MVQRARSFENGADNYDRLRPEFPTELFDDICTSAGVRMTGRILEVGAGTGRATLPLTRRGAKIEVVEPSAGMLEILATRLEEAGLSDRCDLRQATFEDVDSAQTYDVVIAAQSFHWTDPATRWSHLAALLGSEGRAYLFGNGWSVDRQAHDVDAIAFLYAAQGEGLQPDLTDHRSSAGWAESEIGAEAALVLTDSRIYDWPWLLPVDDYLALLRTTSQYAVASSNVREALLDALREILGDQVILHGTSRLLEVAPTL